MKKCIEAVFELENDETIDITNPPNYFSEKKMVRELQFNEIINNQGEFLKNIIREKVYYFDSVINKEMVKIIFYEKKYSFPFASHYRN